MNEEKTLLEIMGFQKDIVQDNETWEVYRKESRTDKNVILEIWLLLDRKNVIFRAVDKLGVIPEPTFAVIPETMLGVMHRTRQLGWYKEIEDAV